MELLSVIRRWRYRDHYSIREISRRTGLSRNTVRKYLHSDSVEPKFNVPDRPSKLDPYADKLSQMLRQEGGKPIDAPPVKPPNALTLTIETQANLERYDALREAREARHAS